MRIRPVVDISRQNWQHRKKQRPPWPKRKFQSTDDVAYVDCFKRSQVQSVKKLRYSFSLQQVKHFDVSSFVIHQIANDIRNEIDKQIRLGRDSKRRMET